MPLSHQSRNGLRSKEAQIQRPQRVALRRVGIARVIRQHPHQRPPEAPRDDGQNQHFHFAGARLPVGALNRQKLWALEVQHPLDQRCGDVAFQPDKPKEPLQAAMV